MRWVLDSNVAVKWLLQEDQSDKARVLRDEFARGLHQLLAPDIFTVECAHALTRAQRQGRVTPAEVNAFMADLLTTLPHFHPHQPLLPRAVDISLRAQHGVYDCLYVALAEREGCEMVTADARLLNNLKPNFPFLIDLASLP
ncbi:MAG TPA: type II toxin-antitoxin system VapC family toxin [Isosphaeraceae bacterium]|nr:type II toxin-antitoxin system VapC family toxin [Isosphaeraceae bacterium]